jgi:acetyl-CoA synthetase
MPDGGLNIAYEAVDRHVAEGRGDRVALRWIAKGKRASDFTYAELAAQSARFCNGLAKLGMEPGDRVFAP